MVDKSEDFRKEVAWKVTWDFKQVEMMGRKFQEVAKVWAEAWKQESLGHIFGLARTILGCQGTWGADHEEIAEVGEGKLASIIC